MSSDSVDELEGSDQSSQVEVRDQNGEIYQDEESSQASHSNLIVDEAQEVNAEESEADGSNFFADDFADNQYNSESDGLGGLSNSSEPQGYTDDSSYSCSTHSTSSVNLLTTTN
jgi:hypothetical protein